MIFNKNINKAIERARLDERKKSEVKIRKLLNDLDQEWKDKVKIIEAEYRGKLSSLEFEIRQNEKIVEKAKKDGQTNREVAASLRSLVSKLIYLSNKKRDHDLEIGQEFTSLNGLLLESETKLIGGK